MDEIIATVVHRRKIAISLFLIIEKLRRQQRNQRHKRLWSRQWLQRRDTHNSVLTMLFKEFG